MSFATRLISLVALVATPLCAPAQASNEAPVPVTDYEVGSTLVCDTQAQVERFAALFTGDAQAAIRVVNAEEQNASACAMMNIAFMRGTKLGMARHGDNAFEMVRILVIGIETDGGIRSVRPAVYFSAFGVKEYAI